MGHSPPGPDFSDPALHYLRLSVPLLARFQGPASGRLRPRTAVNTRRALSTRRRRFPQVRHYDEGGLRRETHGTALGGDTSEHRQAVREQARRRSSEDASELARRGARLIIQRAVEKVFDAWLGRARHERRPDGPPGKRNWFRPRHVQTAEGELVLAGAESGRGPTWTSGLGRT